MYRCEICNHQSKPGQPQLRHAVIREDGNIDREYRVCRRCQANLAAHGDPDVMQMAFRNALPRHKPVPASSVAVFAGEE